MIHNTAIINSKAKISSNVNIGAYTIIGPNVEIDENSEIKSHVCLVGNTKIGKNNKIYPFSSIGNDPQDLKFNGEKTNLEIGDNNRRQRYNWRKFCSSTIYQSGKICNDWWNVWGCKRYNTIWYSPW